MRNCPFCDKEIIDRQKLLETEGEYVIYNSRRGKNRGRCLVIPKRHVSHIGELSEEEAKSLFGTVWLVSNRLREYLNPEGINYGLNEGEIAGQTLFHLHVHIMPRFLDDGMPEFHLFHGDPKKKSKFSDEEMVPLLEEFRKVFAGL